MTTDSGPYQGALKWYDTLNRMEISISGNGWSCARWEDEDKIIVVEV